MKKQKNKQAIKASKLAKAKNMQNKIITVKNAEGDPDTKAEILIQNKINYTPKVSVIIPVYNVEEYLRECLDSVVNQTLKEIEIICVDDGSTDNSLEILKEYAKKDNRITVITQQNLHAGVARNAGLAVARGEYVHFLDSDDWIENNQALKIIYNKIKETQVDILKFKNKTYDNKLKKIILSAYTEISSLPNSYFNKKLKIEKYPDIIKLPDSPWSGIYKLNFIKQNGIYFDSYKCANDVAFFIECASLGTVYVSDAYVVVYRVNNDKSLIGIRHKNFSDQLKMFMSIDKRIKHLKQNLQVEIKARLFSGIGYKIISYFSNENIDNLSKEEIFKIAKDYFINTDITYLIHSQNLIYNITHTLHLRELILRANNYSEYFSLKENQDINEKISHYIDRNGIETNNINIEIAVSVIIPIYNTEKYIEECLDSVCDQTLKNIEIICIDDGSSDNSVKIIEERKKIDSRILLVKQKNMGPAVARNRGIYLARGKYIAFMDSDDFYPSNMTLENMYQAARKHNVNICGGSLKHVKNGDIISDYMEDGYTFKKDGIINYKDYQFDYGFSRFIYDRKLIISNFIYFPEYKRGEDPCFFVKAMVLCGKFYALKQTTYIYRILHKQVKWTEQIVYDILQSYKECLDLALNNNLNLLYKKILERLSSQACINRNVLFLNSYKVLDIIKNISAYPDVPDFYKKFGKKESNSDYKISVIIPVYNTEKYLRECLDSAISQTLKDIEIICINDGSTDNSLQILQEYAKKDDRVKVINQSNQGLSCSRNNALKIAKGQYILFVDSDDLIIKNTCENLYSKAIKNNLDMLQFSGLNFNNLSNEKTNNILWNFTWKNNLRGKLIFNFEDCKNFATKLAVSSCLTMYRFEFLLQNNIRFPEKLCFEDNIFFLKAFMKAKRISIDEEKYYLRRIHSASITQNWDKHMQDYLVITDMVLSYLKEKKVDSDIFNQYKLTYFKTIAWAYNSKCDWLHKKKYAKDIGKLIKKYKVDKNFLLPIYTHNKFLTYALLPYNLFEYVCLKEKYEEQQIKNICHQLKSLRIDIKNFGKVDNDVDITTTAKTFAPAWFANEQGRGRVVESIHKKETLTLKCRGSGKLRLEFRGSDKRFDGTRFPLWIDYKSIKINGKEQLTAPVATWHDKPYRFEMPVKDGQVVTVEIVQQYHQYAKDELQDVILKLNPNSDYIRQNINRLTDKIYDKITVKSATPRVKKPKAASNQELLASIAALNARIERLEQENRDRQAQLLAAIKALGKQ